MDNTFNTFNGCSALRDSIRAVACDQQMDRRIPELCSRHSLSHIRTELMAIMFSQNQNFHVSNPSCERSLWINSSTLSTLIPAFLAGGSLTCIKLRRGFASIPRSAVL